MKKQRVIPVLARVAAALMRKPIAVTATDDSTGGTSEFWAPRKVVRP
jgi:hypothetical protein